MRGIVRRVCRCHLLREGSVLFIKFEISLVYVRGQQIQTDENGWKKGSSGCEIASGDVKALWKKDAKETGG